MVKRGEIWWIDFADPIGSTPGYRRPAVIISANTFNASSLNTVTVALIYSNLNLARHPGNVLLLATDTGLGRDTVVNVTQVSAVDRGQLEDFVGALHASALTRVDAGLRLALDL